MRRKRRTRGGRHTLQVQLDASHPLTQPIAAAANERLQPICISDRSGGGRTVGRVVAHRGSHTPFPGTVPKWITTIPPAVSR